MTHTEYMREWRAKNRDRVHEINRKADAKRRSDPVWREQEKERLRNWTTEHFEQERERKRLWREANPEKMRTAQKNYRWSDEGKASLKRSVNKRRSITRDIVEEYSRVEVFNRDNWTCVGCETMLDQSSATIDHIIPLVKAPSGFVYRNQDVQTMCQPCNASKGSRVNG